jgi:nicotinic acid mononucleotide adenylyltransferase
MTTAIYSVGRFQPPTIGHAALIESLIQLAKQKNGHAFVFVSKTQDTTTNLLNCKTKVDHLRKMFPVGVTFINTEEIPFGGPLLAREYLKSIGYTDFTFVIGEDREAIFGHDARIWGDEPPEVICLPRQAKNKKLNDLSPVNMSGTKARKYAKLQDRERFQQAVTYGNVTEADADLLFDILTTMM